RPGVMAVKKGKRIVRPRVKNEKRIELRDGEEKYTFSSIFLRPRDEEDVLGGLDDILCPGGRVGEVNAVLGDEEIVYLAGPADPSQGGEQALVFVSFDPTFGFDGMKRVDGHRPWRGRSGREREKTRL
ncbi:hypothetical protein LTR41_012244, partial [Exophiala xenobiotica]